MYLLSNLRKRFSAMADLKNGLEYDYSRKVFEIAAEKLEVKLDKAIANLNKGLHPSQSLKLELSALSLLFTTYTIGNFDEYRQQQARDIFEPLIQKAANKGISLSVDIKKGWFGDPDGDTPASMEATIAPITDGTTGKLSLSV